MSRKINYDSNWRMLVHNKLKVPYVLHVAIRQLPKRSRATVVFLHGIGNSGKAWQQVTRQLPADVRVLSIDLLGHGQSPKPQNLTYNVQAQARAVMTTLLHQRALGRVILVGHSMGALVSIEVAKRYPLLVKSLVLCSPPLYGHSNDRNLPLRERQLKKFYNFISAHPDKLPDLARQVQKFNIMNQTFTIDESTVKPFIAALKSSVLEQTSLDDARNIKQPFVIIHGLYDPLVIKSYHQQVVQSNPNGEFKQVLAHHDVRGRSYIKTVVNHINQQITS